MWWIPVGTGLVLAALVGLFSYMQRRKDYNAASLYRLRYLQIVSKLEATSSLVSDLEGLVPAIKDKRVIDYYESILRLLEALLETMSRVNPFGSDPHLLDSANYLAKDCEARTERLRDAFRDSVVGKEVSLDRLFDRRKSRLDSGCYFCSRPAIKDKFSRVRVKMDGKPREVLSCNVCKDELSVSRKVKVLHLMRDGKSVHWSKAEDYIPSEHYWNINMRGAEKKERKLTLVPPVSDDDSDDQQDS